MRKMRKMKKMMKMKMKKMKKHLTTVSSMTQKHEKKTSPTSDLTFQKAATPPSHGRGPLWREGRGEAGEGGGRDSSGGPDPSPCPHPSRETPTTPSLTRFRGCCALRQRGSTHFSQEDSSSTGLLTLPFSQSHRPRFSLLPSNLLLSPSLPHPLQLLRVLIFPLLHLIQLILLIFFIHLIFQPLPHLRVELQREVVSIVDWSSGLTTRASALVSLPPRSPTQSPRLLRFLRPPPLPRPFPLPMLAFQILAVLEGRRASLRSSLHGLRSEEHTSQLQS